jgi:hypothetical protein
MQDLCGRESCHPCNEVSEINRKALCGVGRVAELVVCHQEVH